MQKNVLKKLFISHRNDVILGGALLIAALCLFMVFSVFFQKEGNMIKVVQSGEVQGYYSLDEDGEYEFETIFGYNVLVIEDGYAYMKEASCSDHLCVNQGKISKVGETIICLPNELFITVISGDESDYDAIVN